MYRSILLIASVSVFAASVMVPAKPALTQQFGDERQIHFHVDQREINRGRWSVDQLSQVGLHLFSAKFTLLDGFGRPGATGNGVPTHRNIGSAPLMNRISGMDANSCSGCHNDPAVGGAGDFVNSVFVLGQLADPVLQTIDPLFSNERNTIGMYGAGPIEALAVEMTAELLATKAEANRQAVSSGQAQTRNLLTKGVSFGKITARPDGTFDNSQIEGVDPDLVIKPFHQKGVVNSLRVFTNNAYNHHHGMQSTERFGSSQTGMDDFDGDGIVDELTTGDITAATIFQAALPTPIQVLPDNRQERDMARRGETLFAQAACTGCHKPVLELKNPRFTEPNPYNPAGNLRQQDVTRSFQFDMTKQGSGARLERSPSGGAFVRAFTDLKRHKIADAEDPFFANEKKPQGGVPLDVFITRKLWDCGDTGPWGHRGDCTTIREAILHHAGEARQSRDRFAGMSSRDQSSIIAFLKTLVSKRPDKD
jgi:hypothetical protein